jgi:hypothetical protein
MTKLFLIFVVAFALCMSLLYTWKQLKKVPVAHAVNVFIAGLVATAVAIFIYIMEIS